MAYDSPKTLRRRQQAAENKSAKPRRTRQPQAITISNEQWAKACDFHVGNVREKSAYPDSAAAHAQALVHMALQRRASEIMRELGIRDELRAMEIAKREMFNTEVV